MQKQYIEDIRFLIKRLEEIHPDLYFNTNLTEIEEIINNFINREVKEETGIELDLERLDPFFVLRHFTKNYRGTNKNRVSEIYYFAIENNSEINLSNVDYTKAEKEGKFELRYIDLDNIEGVLEESISWNKKNKIIVEEMLLAINEYKLLLK